MSIDSAVGSMFAKLVMAYRQGWKGILTIKYGLVAASFIYGFMQAYAQGYDNDPARGAVSFFAAIVFSFAVFMVLHFIVGMFIGLARRAYVQIQENRLKKLLAENAHTNRPLEAKVTTDQVAGMFYEVDFQEMDRVNRDSGHKVTIEDLIDKPIKHK